MKKIIVLTVAAIFLAGTAFAATHEEVKKYNNGKVMQKSIIDDMGNTLETKYFRPDGTLEQLIKYDGSGNKIGEAYYGENGKLENSADGWAAMRWKYVDGQMRGEGYYDESGRLTEYKTYNAEGDIIGKEYVGDKEPDPSEEYQPGPTLAGETESFYDSYGRPQGTTSVEIDDDPFFPFWWDPEDF